jgi:hypothetical protein
MDKTMPLKQISVTIQGNTYQIQFPSVGQIIDIETRKSALSAGQYSKFVDLGTIGAFLAKNYVDVISVFSILIPQLLKDLRKESLFDLSPIEMVELTEIYNKQYSPWYNEWIQLITADVKEDKTI